MSSYNPRDDDGYWTKEDRIQANIEMYHDRVKYFGDRIKSNDNVTDKTWELYEKYKKILVKLTLKHGSEYK